MQIRFSLVYHIAPFDKLQVIQNIAARITLNRSKYCSATQCLKELHWLPVKHRIQYKVLVLVYKCVRGEAPDYLINCLHKYQPNRLGLRSGVHNALDLHIPFCTKKTQAERSFSVAGPRLWNNLPVYIRKCNTLESYKKCLKTYLFSAI